MFLIQTENSLYLVRFNEEVRKFTGVKVEALNPKSVYYSVGQEFHFDNLDLGVGMNARFGPVMTSVVKSIKEVAEPEQRAEGNDCKKESENEVV